MAIDLHPEAAKTHRVGNQRSQNWATGSPLTVPVAEEIAELLKERSCARRKGELMQGELYREFYLIVSDSAGWRLTAESTFKFHNF